MIALTFVLYILSAVLSIASAFRRDKRLETAALVGAVLAVIVQTVIILLFYVKSGVFPVFSLKYAVFTFAWSLAVGAIFVSLIFRDTRSIIGFSTPLIIVLLVVFLLLKGGAGEPTQALPGYPAIFTMDIFPVHVLLALISYGLFALSFVASVMYLIQEASLKHKRIAGVTKWLPSLFILDDLEYKTLTIGLPFLTLGIITGSLWAESIYGTYWRWDPKETWSLIIWLLYVFMLHGRISLG